MTIINKVSSFVTFVIQNEYFISSYIYNIHIIICITFSPRLFYNFFLTLFENSFILQLLLWCLVVMLGRFFKAIVKHKLNAV